jgi:hypothetical protein
MKLSKKVLEVLDELDSACSSEACAVSDCLRTIARSTSER